MTSNAPRPCLDCGVLVRGASRCPACRKVKEHSRTATRAPARERGYGADWTRLVARLIDDRKVCAVCGQGATPTDPLGGEHVVAPGRGGEYLDPGNVRVVHRSHRSPGQGGRR